MDKSINSKQPENDERPDFLASKGLLTAFGIMYKDAVDAIWSTLVAAENWFPGDLMQ